MTQKRTIQIKGTTISVLLNLNQNDYICLTDMAKGFEEGPRLIEKWLNNKSTIDFLGVWEQLNNPNFKTPEFGGIRMEAGSNRFTRYSFDKSTDCIIEYGGCKCRTD